MTPRLIALAMAAAVVLPSPSARSDAPVPSAKPPERHGEPQPLASLTIPLEPSPRPSVEEWKSATAVELTRQDHASRQCRAALVREWLAVRCDQSIAAIRQYGGSSEDVFAWVRGKVAWNDPEPAWGQVILRLRPGDRRLIEFFVVEPTDYYTSVGERFMLDETWVEGDARPTLVLQ